MVQLLRHPFSNNKIFASTTTTTNTNTGCFNIHFSEEINIIELPNDVGCLLTPCKKDYLTMLLVKTINPKRLTEIFEYLADRGSVVGDRLYRGQVAGLEVHSVTLNSY